MAKWVPLLVATFDKREWMAEEDGGGGAHTSGATVIWWSSVNQVCYLCLFLLFSAVSSLFSIIFFLFKWVWDGFDGWGFSNDRFGKDGFGYKGLRERWFGFYGI